MSPLPSTPYGPCRGTASLSGSDGGSGRGHAGRENRLGRAKDQSQPPGEDKHNDKEPNQGGDEEEVGPTGNDPHDWCPVRVTYGRQSGPTSHFGLAPTVCVHSIEQYANV